jgi:hypothetical protein
MALQMQRLRGCKKCHCLPHQNAIYTKTRAVSIERIGKQKTSTFFTASNEVILTVTKPRPKVTLTLAPGSASEILPHESVTLDAMVDQPVDEVTITNARTGRQLTVSCPSATSCTASDIPFMDNNGAISPATITVANYVAVARVGTLQSDPARQRVNRILLTPSLEVASTTDANGQLIGNADVAGLPNPRGRLEQYFLEVDVQQPDGTWALLCFRRLNLVEDDSICQPFVTGRMLADVASALRFRAGVYYINQLVSPLVERQMEEQRPTITLDAEDLEIGGGVSTLSTQLTAVVSPVVDGVATVQLRVTPARGNARVEPLTRPNDADLTRYTATVTAGSIQDAGSATYQAEVALNGQVIATSNPITITHRPIE